MRHNLSGIVAQDALPPIKTPPLEGEIDPLIGKLRWAKTDLARFLGVSRYSVSRWAHGRSKAREPEKAAFRFLRGALEVEMGSGGLILPRRFGEWASELHVRGLICARLGIDPEEDFPKEGFPKEDPPEDAGEKEDASATEKDGANEDAGATEKDGENRRPGRVLGPDQIKEIRAQLGWIQAETAAFFGVTHSTPAKWEGPDPGISPATEAELIALQSWASRPEADPSRIRSLWQEGISAFLTDILGWEAGTLPGE